MIGERDPLGILRGNLPNDPTVRAGAFVKRERCDRAIVFDIGRADRRLLGKVQVREQSAGASDRRAVRRRERARSLFLRSCDVAQMLESFADRELVLGDRIAYSAASAAVFAVLTTIVRVLSFPKISHSPPIKRSAIAAALSMPAATTCSAPLPIAKGPIFACAI